MRAFSGRVDELLGIHSQCCNQLFTFSVGKEMIQESEDTLLAVSDGVNKRPCRKSFSSIKKHDFFEHTRVWKPHPLVAGARRIREQRLGREAALPPGSNFRRGIEGGSYHRVAPFPDRVPDVDVQLHSPGNRVVDVGRLVPQPDRSDGLRSPCVSKLSDVGLLECF